MYVCTYRHVCMYVCRYEVEKAGERLTTRRREVTCEYEQPVERRRIGLQASDAGSAAEGRRRREEMKSTRGD